MLPAPTPSELALRDCLKSHVEELAGRIGPRCVAVPEGLHAARDYVAWKLSESNQRVQRQPYVVDGVEVTNLWVDLAGASEEVIVIGAHYDSCMFTPGADDNASGVAAVLELASLLRGSSPRRTLRLMAFPNEEPPYFAGVNMGSRRYATHARDQNLPIVGMMSLEMLGDFRDEPGSQEHPGYGFPSLPDVGNFIGIVGCEPSSTWVQQVGRAFAEAASVPSHFAAVSVSNLFARLSDHSSFEKAGFPGLMVTDGGPLRNHRYHSPDDTPDTLDYDRFARVVDALSRIIPSLEGAPIAPGE